MSPNEPTQDSASIFLGNDIFSSTCDVVSCFAAAALGWQANTDQFLQIFLKATINGRKLLLFECVVLATIFCRVIACASNLLIQVVRLAT